SAGLRGTDLSRISTGAGISADGGSVFRFRPLCRAPPTDRDAGALSRMIQADRPENVRIFPGRERFFEKSKRFREKTRRALLTPCGTIRYYAPLPHSLPAHNSNCPSPLSRSCDGNRFFLRISALICVGRPRRLHASPAVFENRNEESECPGRV